MVLLNNNKYNRFINFKSSTIVSKSILLIRPAIILTVFFFSLVLLPQLIFAQKNTEQVLRWAADAEGNAPYIIHDPKIPTNLIGFEVDIALAIADVLGMKAQHVQNQWDGLIPGLARDDYDIVLNGLEITEDRKREVFFSEPYYLTYEQLIVKADKQGITNLSDLVGKSAGALKNSLAERILVAKGGIDVRSYEGEVNALTDMINGRIDAVLVDAPIATYYAVPDKRFKLVGQPIGEISYGIAVGKNNIEMQKKINYAIQKIKNNGKLREILDQWNLWNYMMAMYTNDKSQSNVMPKNFQYFIESKGQSDNDFFTKIQRYINFLPLLTIAALTTLEISIISMLIAVVFGLLIALIRVYSPKPFSSLAVLYIEIVRGTPLLIQLYFVFYVLPTFGLKLTPLLAAVIGLGLNYAAYEAENYRAGIFSVPRGQLEAAISLGMNQKQALRHVIIPQAIRLVIPPVTNDFISLLKDSSLVSVITMVELTKVYYQIASSTYDFFGTGIIVAVLYLLLGIPFVRLARFVEERFAIDRKTHNRWN